MWLLHVEQEYKLEGQFSWKLVEGGWVIFQMGHSTVTDAKFLFFFFFNESNLYHNGDIL